MLLAVVGVRLGYHWVVNLRGMVALLPDWWQWRWVGNLREGLVGWWGRETQALHTAELWKHRLPEGEMRVLINLTRLESL